MGARIATDWHRRRCPSHPQRLWRSPEPKHAYDVGHRGRRRPRPGDRVLPREEPRHHRRGGPGARLARASATWAATPRSSARNYLWDASAAIYEFSLKLWEGLEADLDFDVLLSQRGVVNLAHSLGDVREGQRRVAANRRQRRRRRVARRPPTIKDLCPIVNVSPDVRYPILGGTYQRRGGVARHDRVAWGYAGAPTRWAWTSSRAAR